MSYQSVDVYVLDNTPLKRPVAGVLVRVFDSSNVAFFTEDVTDADGHVGFTLWTQAYALRFFKFGTQVTQPQYIDVVDTVGVLNFFEASATVFSHPVANDSRLCRASGYFRDITGAPNTSLRLQFIGQFNPMLLDGAGVLGERRTIQVTSAGYACIDLIRCAQYTVTLAGMEDTQRSISIPDAPSVNLPDLLFPVVSEVSLSPSGPYAIQVGGTLELEPTVMASNQVPLTGTATGDIRWYSSDPSVFAVSVGQTKLTLTGLSAGTAELSASRVDTSIIRIPNTEILGVPVQLTVTP